MNGFDFCAIFETYGNRWAERQTELNSIGHSRQRDYSPIIDGCIIWTTSKRWNWILSFIFFKHGLFLFCSDNEVDVIFSKYLVPMNVKSIFVYTLWKFTIYALCKVRHFLKLFSFILITSSRIIQFRRFYSSEN